MVETRKKTIWLNPPLDKVIKEIEEKAALEGKGIGKKAGRSGGFSQRLGDIAARYDAIMSLTPVPEVTDEEFAIIGEVICGSVIDSFFVRLMHEAVLDCAGSKEELEALSQKVATWTPAERVAFIEKYVK